LFDSPEELERQAIRIRERQEAERELRASTVKPRELADFYRDKLDLDIVIVNKKQPYQDDWYAMPKFDDEEFNAVWAEHGARATGVGLKIGSTSDHFTAIDIDIVDDANRLKLTAALLEVFKAIGKKPWHTKGKKASLLFRVERELIDGEDYSGLKQKTTFNETVELFTTGRQVVLPGSLYYAKPSDVFPSSVYRFSNDDESELTDTANINDYPTTLPDVLTVEEWQRVYAALRKFVVEEEPKKAAKKAKAERKATTNYSADSGASGDFEYKADDVRQQFNQGSSVEAELEAMGYTASGDGYEHPNNDSTVSVKIANGYSTHWGANDPIRSSQFGSDNRDGSKSFDAFNLHAHRRGFLDKAEAFKAISAELGMDGRKPSGVSVDGINAEYDSSPNMLAAEPLEGRVAKGNGEDGKREGGADEPTEQQPKGKAFFDSLIRMDEVEPEAVDWLWLKRFPCRTLSLIAGRGGVGKSTIAYDIAARLSTGSDFPDGSQGVQARTLIVSAEDAASITIRPRLDAAGADASKIVQIPMIRKVERKDKAGKVVEEKHQFTLENLRELSDGLTYAKTQAGYEPFKFLIIDPIGSFMSGKDGNSDPAVREVLNKVMILADEQDLSVILICHFNKGKTSDIKDKVMGSAAFINTVRSAFVAAEDRDGTKRFIHVKANLSELQATIEYETVGHTYKDKAGRFIETSKIEWGQTTDYSAEDLADDMNQRVSKIDEGEQFLQKHMSSTADNRLPVAGITKLAERDGIGEQTLRRAAKRLGMETKRVGFGKDGKQFWVFPDDGSSDDGADTDGDGTDIWADF